MSDNGIWNGFRSAHESWLGVLLRSDDLTPVNRARLNSELGSLINLSNWGVVTVIRRRRRQLPHLVHRSIRGLLENRFDNHGHLNFLVFSNRISRALCAFGEAS